LYLDGFDLRGASLIDRKRVLETLLQNSSGVQLIKYVEHIAGDGELVFEHVCKLGLEGIASKLHGRALLLRPEHRLDQDKVPGVERSEQGSL